MDHVNHQTEIQPKRPPSRKFGRANALRKAQVLPPHQVDLTLSPTGREDVRLPATISGMPMGTRPV